MVETFILIAVLKAGYGTAAITQEFYSKRACEFAVEQIEARDRNFILWMICVPSGRT